MECLLLYLDDLEDLVFAIPLAAERIRRRLAQLVAIMVFVAVQAALIWLAIRSPALGAGVASLLAVGALCRLAVGPARTAAPSA